MFSLPCLKSQYASRRREIGSQMADGGTPTVQTLPRNRERVLLSVERERRRRGRVIGGKTSVNVYLASLQSPGRESAQNRHSSRDYSYQIGNQISGALCLHHGTEISGLFLAFYSIQGDSGSAGDSNYYPLRAQTPPVACISDLPLSLWFDSSSQSTNVRKQNQSDCQGKILHMIARQSRLYSSTFSPDAIFQGYSHSPHAARTVGAVQFVANRHGETVMVTSL